MPESISHFLKHVQIKPVREGQSEADVYRCYDLKTGRGISDICFLKRQKEKYYNIILTCADWQGWQQRGLRC